MSLEETDFEIDREEIKPADLKMSRNAATVNTGRDRPRLSILPYNGQVYAAGATTYGGDKYSRGNYFGPPPAAVAPVDRFLEYLDAAQRHIGKIAQAINIAKGTGGDQRAACALPDDEASGGFPASNLPHIAHAIAGLMIAVECGISDGLLPADPGQPWKRDPMYADVLARRGAAPVALAQKDDPDAERKRVVDAKLAARQIFGEDISFEPGSFGAACVDIDTRFRRDAEARRVQDAAPLISVGDRVRVLGCSHAPSSVGCSGTVTKVDPDDPDLPFQVETDRPIPEYGNRIWCSAVEVILPFKIGRDGG